MASKESKKIQILVVVAALLIILASVLTTMIVSGRLGGSNTDRGYQNITFTDAVLSCESNLKKTYKNKIKILYIDNHSSRYDNKTFQYKLFFNLNLKGKNKVSINYVNCFVRAATGSIVKLDVMEEVDRPNPDAPGQTTNAFGWPKKGS